MTDDSFDFIHIFAIIRLSNNHRDSAVIKRCRVTTQYKSRFHGHFLLVGLVNKVEIFSVIVANGPMRCGAVGKILPTKRA